MRLGGIIAIMVSAALLSAPLRAQTQQGTESLGEAARKAREARNNAASGKTFNNDSLAPAPVRTEPARTEPVRTDPAPTEPVRTGSRVVDMRFWFVNQPPGPYTLIRESRLFAHCGDSSYAISKRYPAQTEPHFEIAYEGRPSQSAGGWTYTAKLTAKASPTVTLPEWTNIPDDPAFKTAWKQMVDGLLKHEEGHVNIILEAVRQWHGSTITGKGRTSAEATQDFVRQRQELLDKYAARQAEYDALTNHGINQSALGGTDIPSDCPPNRK